MNYWLIAIALISWTALGMSAFIWDMLECTDVGVKLFLLSILIGLLVGPIGWLFVDGTPIDSIVLFKQRKP